MADDLIGLGRVEEALQVYDRLLSRLVDSTSHDAAADVATAALSKALLLERIGRCDSKAALLWELNRREEAIAVYSQLLDTFSDDETELVARVVACAGEAREQLLEADD
jgi:tetratricopeptide (TPR) repeat protein